MARVKALVTGGAGFIGSNLVRRALERGDDVRVLDNFSTGNRANLAGLDAEIVEGELRSYERVHNAVRGDRGRLPPRRARLGAALGAGPAHLERRQRRGHAQRAARRARLGRAARRLRVELVGLRHEPRAADAGATPPDPISPYGVAKLAAERYCISFSRVYDGLETVVLRYFNVFGPRQSPYSEYAAMVPLFIAAVMRGEPVTIHGDGEQSRGFTYVANVVDATMRAADAPTANGRIFNVSAGAPATVNEVADAIGRILGKPVERRHGPPRVGDIRASWADVDRRARDARLGADGRPRGGCGCTAERLA